MPVPSASFVRPEHRRRGRRRLTQPLLAAVVLAGSIVAGPLLAADPAGAAPATAHRAAAVEQYDFATGLGTVVTSTGKHLSELTGATADPSVPSLSDASVDLFGPKQVESHSWQFPVGVSALAVTSGGGSFASGSAFGAFGNLSLTFTHAGAAKATCIGGSRASEQPVRVHGRLVFVTGSTGPQRWGDVNAAVSGIGDLTTITTSPCTVVPHDCAVGLAWARGDVPFSSAPAYLAFGGSNGVSIGAGDRVILSRLSHLASPSGAQRIDVVDATAPAPRLTVRGSAATLVVTTSPGSAAHGSATLRSLRAPTHSTAKCSATKSQTTTDWASASFTNGSTPLRATEQIFGTIGVPDLAHPTGIGNSADFLRVS